MKKAILTSLSTVAFSALTVANTSAAIVTTAEYQATLTQDFGFGGSGSIPLLGQTFIATVSGQVDEVAIHLAQNGPTPAASATFFIFDTVASIPTGAPLGALNIDLVGLNLSLTEYVVDFSAQNVQLQSGEVYAIAVSSDDSLNWAFDEPGSYADGNLISLEEDDGGLTEWRISSNDDLGYRITVNTVPEPSNTTLFAVGLGGVVLRRRR